MSDWNDRLESKIDASGDCWEWTAGTNGVGYGKVYVEGRLTLAHRAVYEALVGEIPEGLVLDHLCRRTLCVNPDHLEPVTMAENFRRGAPTSRRAFRYRQPGNVEVCGRGHDMTPENTRNNTTTGKRQCKACRKLTRSHE